MQLYDHLAAAIAEERPISSAVVIAGDGLGAHMLIEADGARLGSLGSPTLDEAVAADALALLAQEQSEARAYGPEGATQVFIESHAPPAHLVIVGAVHIGMALCACAKELDFRVTVVDPRPIFVTPERFPHADALIAEWPEDAFPGLRMGPSTYVAVLTHDPKLDDPAVRLALALPVRYIGAIGSLATQEKRRAALRADGVAEADLARIHGPIGLDIGGRTPGEIAVSILAEMIAVRNGRVTP